MCPNIDNLFLDNNFRDENIDNMKNSLQGHIELIFRSLNIDSGFEIYDCLTDELPDWAKCLSHPFQYLICSLAIDKINEIKIFIGKDIYVHNDNVLYWYEGDYIEPKMKKTEDSLDKHSISVDKKKMSIALKTDTRLPVWLDDFIFNSLNAQYAPNYERFDFNLDLSRSDVLKYLGTYFPRSYGESFCIFDNLFQNKGFYSCYNQLNDIINIVVIGCGTGGDLIGLLTVIDKYSTYKRGMNIVAVDGNIEAIQILKQIIERFKGLYKGRVSLKIITHTYKDINDFNENNVGPTKSFDFVISAKMISEIIASNERNNNAYYSFVKTFLPLIKDTGIFYILDVTTKQKHSTFNPLLMNQQINSAMKELDDYKIISPIPCAIFNGYCTQTCFYQKVFTVSHSRIISDKSKVAYKLISSNMLAGVIGCPKEGVGIYQIQNDKPCPNTKGWKGDYFDAFYINTGDNMKFSDADSEPIIDLGLSPKIFKEEPTSIIGSENLSASENLESGKLKIYYIGCYIIDTNVFLDFPDILSKITNDYFVVLSAKVIDELDYLKTKKNMSLTRKKRITKALKNISQNMGDRKIVMEDSDTRLLPKDFDKNSSDNKILSVALKFIDENPILLTSDYSLQVRARGLGLKSISLKDFFKTTVNIN